MIILLTVGLIEKTQHKSVNIFLNQNVQGNLKIELDLFNYRTKFYLKNATDLSNFAKKVDLASLKSHIDKLDINELEKYQKI